MSDIKLRVAKFVADLSIDTDIDYNLLLNHIYDQPAFCNVYRHLSHPAQMDYQYI